MSITHYEPLAGYNPMRARARFYIWDADTLEDGPYDVMAMERALNGEPTELNEAERYETARRLYGLLRSEDDLARRNKLVAERVGTSDRTIARWQKEGWPARDFAPDGNRVPHNAAAGNSLEERWLAATQPGDNGHLEWTGSHYNGVPIIRFQKTTTQAARYAWQRHHGTDPRGSVRPACGNDMCVNIDHLEDRLGPIVKRKQQVVAA